MGQERRLTGVMRELDPGWIPTLPSMQPGEPQPSRRALYLLEASLPHTPSGYAYRSRDVLRALRDTGLDPVAATRLGFPSSRGVRNYSAVEEVDGVVHHRFNVPGLRQYSGIPIDVQLQRNAECLLDLAEVKPRVLVLHSAHPCAMAPGACPSLGHRDPVRLRRPRFSGDDVGH